MRSYAAQDIVTLPMLNTASAVALGQQLLTALKRQTTLSPLVTARASALEKAHTALSQALANKPKTQLDPTPARTADQEEDHAFRTLHDWLDGWCKLSTPDGDQARAMYAVIFPNGLKFTHLPYKQEWAEAQAKLTRITQEGYDVEIQKLGGKPILDHLVATHQVYGQSIGITTETLDSSINLREPLLAFNKYLRAYVVAVAAHTDPDDDASGALADALLAPLHNWQTYVAATGSEPQPQPGPQPPATQPGTGTGTTTTQPSPGTGTTTGTGTGTTPTPTVQTPSGQTPRTT